GAVIATLLMLVAVAAPSTGVTSVGVLAKTAAPVPVSSVIAAARFALEGVPRKVATPVARPDTPVAIGRAVPFVSVIVGAVPNTSAPVPVSSLMTPASCADVVAAN